MLRKIISHEPAQKEFFGMKYPFKECARPALLKSDSCLDCSVRQFCEAPEKKEAN